MWSQMPWCGVSCSSATMWWCALTVIFCAKTQAILFTQEPRLETTNGHLFIIGAEDKNVTLATSGRGVVTINGRDVRGVVEDAAAAVSNSRARAATVNYLQADVRKLQQAEAEMRMQVAVVYGMMNNASGSANPVMAAASASGMRALSSRIRRIEENLVKNECNDNPCRHGGTCIDLYMKYKCLCPDGWEGKKCKRDTNECLDLMDTGLGCLNGATCINTPGSFRCQCAAGFFGKDCAARSNNCSAGSSREMCDHGICVNDALGHKCICDQGWGKMAGQEMCSQDVDECITAPCSRIPKVNCINIPGSFRCESCPQGFSGNGHSCDDVNECSVSNGGCSVTPLVACRNTYGSFRCGPCPPGYVGDGVTCEYVGRCRVDNGGCHPHAVCHEIGTSVQCTCAPGYLGTGLGPNGCLPSALAPTSDHPCVPNPCVNGLCVLTSTYNFTCQCFFGFRGARCQESGDPCTGVKCQNGGTCIVDGNSFRCLCSKYYSGRYCGRERSVCGGQLRMDSGVLEFPTTSSVRYKANQNCAWTISVNASLVVQIVFDEFDLEPPRKSECVADWLQIYDGKEIGTSSMLGKFCGNEKPLNGTVTSSANDMFLWFRSDSTSQHMGFKLHWNATQPECGGVLNGSVHGVFSSPGSPGKYPAGRDCHWTLTSSVTQRISFTFFSLNIEEHSNCDFDFIEFFDGDSTSSPSMMRYCTTVDSPAPFVSSGPVVHVHFHSDSISSDKGFQISYSPVPGIEGCGGIHTDSRGEIRSVMLGESYRNNLDCVWIVRGKPQQRVKITFKSFDVEKSTSCRMDFVEVRHGKDASSPLAGKYCGNNIPQPITSLGPDLYIRFRTDVSLGNDGFVILYEQLCELTFTDTSGIIKSPNYPVVYPNMIDCIYRIDLPPSKTIILDFLDFDVERGSPSSSRCFADYLEVRDGLDENSKSHGKFCGSSRPDTIVSNYNKLWMKFHTDSSVQSRGWVANYTSVDVTCGGIHHELSGVIRSPTDNGLYPHETECNWIIKAPTGYVIQLSFNMFDIESSYGDQCNFDHLEISDGHQVLRGWPYTSRSFVPTKAIRLCGVKIPEAIHSTSNIMYLKFRSDSSISSRGFELSYIAEDESTRCGGNYIATNGAIKSPGYPNNYPDSRRCIWTIKVENGKQIRLRTVSFSLEDSTTCDADYVEIRSGISAHSPLMGKYCGANKPPVITSFSNSISITFVADTAVNNKGFKIMWDSSTSGCGGTMSAPSGTITSPNYPEPYGRNAVCNYRIRVANGNLVELIIIDLQLEQGNNCNDDYLEIFDAGRSLGRRCAPTQMNSIFSSTNQLNLKFVSDFAMTDKGFHLTYRTKCNVTSRGERGVIESPAYPNEIQPFTVCSWMIESELGHTVNLSFSEMNLNDYDCHSSYIEVRDETGTLGKYCVGNRPPSIISSKTRTVNVTLVTDDFEDSYASFRIEWIAVGCGGTLTKPFGKISSPNYPAPYPHNVRCVWNIRVEPEQSIRLNINDMNFEHSHECYTDGIMVYGGADSSAPLLTKLCSTQMDQTSLLSSHNEMQIIFWSDSSFTGRGFDANYTTQAAGCGGHFNGSRGAIHSRNYPKNYDLFDDCLWFITVPANHRVNLTFHDFDLPGDEHCVANYVEIFEGIGTNGTSLSKLCGNRLPNVSTVSSVSNTMTVRLRSNETAKGFYANYSMSCGAAITVAQPGIIHLNDHTMFSNYEYNCSWLLMAPDTDGHITVTPQQSEELSEFFCSYTNYKVYDGDNENSTFLADLCSSTPSTRSYTSTGNTLFVQYYSTTSMDTPLALAYTSVDSACGGDFNALQGNIANPGYPGSATPNIECVWTLLAAPGNKLHLSWKEFSLLDGEHCDVEYVEIRKGTSTAELIGTYCGTSPPSNITSDTGIWMKFSSGPPSASNGRFYAEFAHIYVHEVTGASGEIANPLYPRQIIQTPFDFTWRITVTAGQKIRISFMDLLILDCEYQSTTLSIFDGYDSTAISKSYCGVVPQEPMVTSSNVAFIKMEYSYSYSGSRFKLKWEEISSPFQPVIYNTTSDCGGDLALSPQMRTLQVTSPGYPNSYSTYKHCAWKIRAPPGYHIGYTISDMQINSSPGCVYDFVAAYAGEDDSSKMVGRYCRMNDTFSTNAVEVGSVLYVVFQSSFMAGKPGFSMQVDLVAGGDIVGSMGTLDLNWNGTVWRRWLQVKEYHDWVISVERGRQIQASFDEFDVPTGADGKCGDKYVVLRNGHHSNSPLLGAGKFCGSKPRPIRTSGESLFVRAYIPWRTSTFVLKFQEVVESCGGRLVLPEGSTSSLTINTPSYPNSPPPKIECVWIVQAPPGKTMQIDFIGRFDLKFSKDCISEYVEVLDGGTMLANSLGRFCQEAPSTIRSSDNLFYVKYFTNLTDPNNGFSAKISQEKCGGVVRDSAGVIRSPNYPNLQSNMDCLWTIETQPHKQLKIYAVDFDMPNIVPTEPGGRVPASSTLSDFRKFIWVRRSSNCTLSNSVLIYEPTLQLPISDVEQMRTIQIGPRAGMGNRIYIRRPLREQEDMLAIGCHVQPLPNVTTSTNKVFIRLLTSELHDGEFRGFKINFTSVRTNCGGELTTPHGVIQSPYYLRETPRPYYCRWYIMAPMDRRITLRTDDFDLAGSRMEQRLYIYEEFAPSSSRTYDKLNPPPPVYQSIGNTLMVAYHTVAFSGRIHNGFKLTYSTDTPAPCGGKLTASEGVLENPQNLTSFICEWELPTIRSGSFVFTTSPSLISNLTVNCEHAVVGLFVHSPKYFFVKSFCGETSRQVFASPLPQLKVSAVGSASYAPTLFSLSYYISSCGGVINSSALPYTITSPNYPRFFSPNTHCAWLINADEGQTLKVDFNEFDLGASSCDNHLDLYNGPNSNSPLIGSFCSSRDNRTIVTQGNNLFIEFHSLNAPSKGFRITIDNNHTVCGGVISHSSITVKSPNYPRKYDANTECEWQFESAPGSHIGLVFTDRFYLEKSTDCVNDSLSIYDYLHDDWQLITSLCGRTVPQFVNSTSSKMRLTFRSNEAVEGDGFIARWEKNCGSELYGPSGVVTSPNYPKSYPNNVHCEYYIRGNGQLIHLAFTSFSLEEPVQQCIYDYIEIEEIKGNSLGRYCGSSKPPDIDSTHDVKITFVSDRYFSTSGYVFEYEIERCGGVINTSQVIEYTYSRASTASSCLWKINAPPDMIVSLQLVNVSLGASCQVLNLAVMDSDNSTLARVCGHIGVQLPIVSTSNAMDLILTSKYRYYSQAYFTAYVIFTYGPKQGCGGNLVVGDNPESISSPDINRDGRYEEFLDCHWIISAREGYHITAKVLTIDVDSCNSTDCSCDYLEFRNGIGLHDEIIVKTCGKDAPDRVISSANQMWMRFVSDGSYSGRGFTVQLSTVRSTCGVTALTATREVQTLTSPGYPNHYPEDIRCSWIITVANESSKPSYLRSPIHVYVKSWDTEDSSDCTQDYLSIEDTGNRLFSKSEEKEVGSSGMTYQGRINYPVMIRVAYRRLIGKTRYCGSGNSVDFYAISGSAQVDFVSNAGLAKKGFVIEYSISPCARNYTAPQGRIKHSHFLLSEMCTIEIHAPQPNQTIALYFASFAMPNDCEKTYLQVKDGTLSSSNQLLKACGYGRPSPVYSTGPHLYINMFTSVSTYTDVDITYTTTDRGAGCGGELYNYGGYFTSPQYPENVRSAAVCEWKVTVPEGLDLNFEFMEFNLGAATTCNTDFIEFYDVMDDGGLTYRSKFCGGDNPARILGNTGVMVVRYTRSVHNGGSGWALSFAGVAPDSTYYTRT